MRQKLAALEEEFALLARQYDENSAVASACKVYSSPTWRSLLRAICGKPLEAWPHLCACDEHVAIEAAQAYARPCVLDDRLVQINNCVEGDDKDLLLRELRCGREWDWKKDPAWLAFEVEKSIRIWPEHYNVAKALLDRKGNVIAQLNGTGLRFIFSRFLL